MTLNNQKKFKARTELSKKVSKALEPFDKYGLGDFIPSAHKAIIEAAEKFVKEMNNDSDLRGKPL